MELKWCLLLENSVFVWNMDNYICDGDKSYRVPLVALQREEAKCVNTGTRNINLSRVPRLVPARIDCWMAMYLVSKIVSLK